MKQVNDAMTGIEKSGMEAGKRIDNQMDKAGRSVKMLGDHARRAFNDSSWNRPAGILQKLQQQLDSLRVKQQQALNVADIKRYNAEIKKTEAEMRKLNDTSDKGGRIFGELKGMIAGAFAVGAIVNFAKQSVDAFLEAEKAARKLNFAMNGNAKAIAALNDQAEKYKQTGLFDDEEITNAQAFLAQQGRTEEQIRKTIDAATKLSVVTGDDLQTSIEKLDMTYEGSIGRLGKLDARFKDLTEEELKNGAAIDILNEKYKGTIEEMANSTEARLGQTKNLWGDFKEVVGQTLINGIVPMSVSMDDLTQRTYEHFKSLGFTTEQQKALNEAMKDGKLTLDELGRAMNAASAESNVLSNSLSDLTDLLTIGVDPDKFPEIFTGMNAILEAAQKLKKETDKIKNKGGFKGPYEQLQEQIQVLETRLKNETAAGSANVEVTLKQLEAKRKLLASYDDQILQMETAIMLEQMMTEKLKEQAPIIEENANDIEGLGRKWKQASQTSIKAVGETIDMGQSLKSKLKGAAAGGAEGGMLGDLTGFTEENVKKIIDNAQEFIGALGNVFAQQAKMYQDIAQKRRQAVDDLRKDLDTELQLNQQGFASNVELKRKELAEAERAQEEALKKAEKAARKQAQIEALAQAASMATTVADIIKYSTKEAGGVPGAIAGVLAAAAIVAQFFAMKNAFISKNKYEHGGTGIFGGRRHSDGGTYVSGIGEAEKGERWAIFSRDATAKHKALPDLIDGINSGNSRKAAMAFASMMGFNPDATKGIDAGVKNRELNINSKVSLNEVAEIREMRDALITMGKKQIYIDKHGRRIEISGNRKRIIH